MHTIPLTRTIAPIRTSSIRERITRLEEFEGVDALIPQVAARQLQGCPNQIQKRDGTFVTVDHRGGVPVWRVSSGGRMGAVFGTRCCSAGLQACRVGQT